MLLVRCMLVDFGILFGIVDAGLSVQHQPNLSDVTLPCPAPTAFLAWYTWVYPKLHADSKKNLQKIATPSGIHKGVTTLAQQLSWPSLRCRVHGATIGVLFSFEGEVQPLR